MQVGVFLNKVNNDTYVHIYDSDGKILWEGSSIELYTDKYNNLLTSDILEVSVAEDTIIIDLKKVVYNDK